MLEAWFFGEKDALLRAGVPRDARVLFDKYLRDIEKFETEDELYLDPEISAYWACGIARRARHPKNYIHFLHDPRGVAPRRERYRERRQGVAALTSLDWAEVTTPRQHATMVAALLDDIAEMAGACLSFDPGDLNPLLSKRSDGCLRNIA
jgi:hypothetical protein